MIFRVFFMSLALMLLSIPNARPSDALPKNDTDVNVKLLKDRIVRICEINELEQASCERIQLPQYMVHVEGVVKTVQVPSAKVSFIVFTKSETFLCAITSDLSKIHCGVVSDKKERVAITPVAPAVDELSTALRRRTLEKTDVRKDSRFIQVAKTLELNVTSGMCKPYSGEDYELEPGEAWCDEPCVGNNHCPKVEITAPGPGGSLEPTKPPIGIPPLPPPVWPTDPNWCNVLGILCDSPPTPPPPPTPEECRKVYDDGVSECNRIYEGSSGGALPGTGSDMPGRWRRCVREYMNARGCFNF